MYEIRDCFECIVKKIISVIVRKYYMLFESNIPTKYTELIVV